MENEKEYSMLLEHMAGDEKATLPEERHMAARENGDLPEDDILTAEDYARLEALRNKPGIGDNWLVLGLKSFLLMNAGEILFSIPLGIVIAILMLNGYITLNTDFNPDMLMTMSFFSSDFLNTCMMYASFAGVWMFLLFWFAVRRKNRPLFRALSTYTKGNTLKKLGIGLLLGAGMNGLCILLAWLHGDVELSFSHFSILPLLLILFFVLVQSSAEELVCRGYYYQRLMKRYKDPKVAIVVNSLFFALLHLANSGITVLSFLDIILSGLLFSFLVYYMDSFWAAAACHTAWNYTQNIIFGLPNSGTPASYSIFALNTAAAKNSLFYNRDFGIEGSVASVLVQLAVILLIWLYCKNKEITPTDIWEDRES